MVEGLGQQLWDPEGYRIWRTDGTDLIVEDPNDMIHWRGWNPTDPRLGISPLETLRNVIAEDAALQASIVELAKTGLTGPVYVTRPLDAPDWGNEGRTRFEEDLTNRLRKVSTTPPVMEEGMDIKGLGVSPRDAESLSVRQYATQQNASLFGVPLGMVGLEPASEESQDQFYSDCLPPYCEAFTRQLNLSVLIAEFGLPDYCFEFNLDEKLMGNERLKTLTSASGRPVLLTNEARAMLNKPPVDGGEELVTPANVIVGDNPKPSTDIMPIQDPNKPSQEGDYREDEPKRLNGRKQLDVPQWESRFQADMNRQHRYVDEIQGVLTRFYTRQRNVLLGKSAEGKDVDWDRFDNSLSESLHAKLKDIVDREGSLYVQRLLGDDFDMRQVQNYLKATSEGIAQGINDATKRDIEENGVEEALSRGYDERAAVAAATIGTRATRFARYEAAKQSPGYENRLKTWVAHTDRHANLNGASVPMNATWGGIEPGSLPNCKCSVSIS
jgi:hypothetical protein